MKQNLKKKIYIADIYCTKTGKYYYVPKSSVKDSTEIKDVQSLERINMDVDPRGGIRVVHLKQYEDVKGVDLEILLPNVRNNFMPVTAQRSPRVEGTQVLVPYDVHKVLGNDYLSLKEYVFASVDGVRYKIKATKRLLGDNRGNPTDCIYDVIG